MNTEHAHEKDSTLGSFLRSRRMEQGISLEEIESMTHIGQSFLVAIEENKWSLYSGKIYAKGHVRGYSEALGLSAHEVLERFRDELNAGFPEKSLYTNPLLSVSMRMRRVW